MEEEEAASLGAPQEERERHRTVRQRMPGRIRLFNRFFKSIPVRSVNLVKYMWKSDRI